MGTYIIATLLFLALAYALYKIFSKRGKCCGCLLYTSDAADD